MARQLTGKLPQSIDETRAMLEAQDYLAGTALATVLFLALRMKRPLFLEGEAGVGKTEIAKVLARALDRPSSGFSATRVLMSPRPSTNGTIRLKCWKSACRKRRAPSTAREWKATSSPSGSS